MKVAPKLIFLFRDDDGFASTISNALQPSPNSTIQRFEETFELSLERYGIEDHKASGDAIHFVDGHGQYEVTVLLLKKYDPPVLVCALNEVLASIKDETSSVFPTIVLPIVVPSSNLKVEKGFTSVNHVSVYGLQVGADTETIRAVIGKTQNPPPSLQVHHEQLACFLHLIRALKLSSCVLIGQSGISVSSNSLKEEIEMICQIGEVLTSISQLSFLREKVTWNPTKTSKETKEAWRALYG